MAVPDYQSIMLPLLKIAGDGNELSKNETIERLAQQFGLSESERNEMLPSGTQRKFDDRVSWARTYMQKALLLSSSGRSKFRITERGMQVLKENPPTINDKFLRQFPEFIAFKTRTDKEGKVDENNLASQELIERIKNSPSKFFENLVVDVLVAMGYGGSRKDAGQAVGQVGDGGIDGIIKEDKLGLDAIYLQAKRWEGRVSRPVVQGFVGALIGKKTRKGVFITTSNFSQQALDYAI